MKTYKFTAGNGVIFAFTVFFLLVGGGFLLAFTLPKGNSTIFILSFVGLILFIIYMVRLTSFAKVEVTIDDNTISIKWLEKFLWGNKSDITISFNDIAAYIEQSDSSWDWLKIEMKDGNIYKIWRSNTFLTNGDYSEFISAFISSVENHNIGVTKNSLKENLTTIKRAKSIYETTGGLIMVGFVIVLLVVLPTLIIIFPSTKEPNYFIIGLGYIGATYFVFQVYTERKKGKTE